MSSLQKIIQHQVGVKSSLYTNELGASNSKINNTNSGKKHNSYQRRLNELKRKKKDNLYARQYTTSTPLIGNKKESYEIVSRGLTPNNFLNCSIPDYINHFGFDTAYNNYPKQLRLNNNNLEYPFLNDLTFFQDNNGENYGFDYGTYNVGGTQSIDASFITSGLPVKGDSNNSSKVLYFIDFNISNNINDLSNNELYIIFEIGSRFRGTSLIIYKETDGITLDFFCGDGRQNDSNNIIFTKTNFDISKRHSFVASFEKVSINRHNYKIYIDNELMEEKEEQDTFRCFIHPSVQSGFGYMAPNLDSNANISVRNYYGNDNDDTDGILAKSRDNILEITGEVKVLKNTYDEFLKSNMSSLT